MARIQHEVTTPDGVVKAAFLEAPVKDGKAAIAYLRSSGTNQTHPIGQRYDSLNERWIPEVSGVSDQKWIYDVQEAAEAQRQFPDRFVPVVP